MRRALQGLAAAALGVGAYAMLVEPHWLEENLGKVLVVDVREPAEFAGPLGHIRGAKLVPLGELAQRAAELPRDKPVVTVCRAGSRSPPNVLACSAPARMSAAMPSHTSSCTCSAKSKPSFRRPRPAVRPNQSIATASIPASA